jgi:hypothetical protein
VTLFGFKNTGPIAGHDDRHNEGRVTGRRWALVVYRWRIELENQWQWNNGEWSYSAGYYGLGFCWQWMFGHDMAYYDGEHHSFDLGPFYVTWFR